MAMPRALLLLLRRRLVWLALLLTVWLLCSGEAQAASLADRLQAFPQWPGKLALQDARGDLLYPDWMQGTWMLTSTLVEVVAPLAPEIVTPGLESNQAMVNQPVTCPVRFGPVPQRAVGLVPRVLNPKIVADRAFNGLSLARAYLGEAAVQSVKVDPNNPNRQLTQLAQGRQLESTVTARATESPSADQFITAERFQQTFRGGKIPYLNQVETTTHYTYRQTAIDADQVTAVYLSPQDPDFLKALNRPVALYRYHLQLTTSSALE